MTITVPTDISGCKLWLKADAGTYSDTGLTTPTTTDNTTIKGWADQSGNSANFVATPGPTLKNNIQNSLPVLRYNGTSHYLLNSTLGPRFRSTNPFTLFLALSCTTAAASQIAASWNTAAQDSDYGFVRIRSTSDTPNSQGSRRVFADANIVADAVAIGTAFALIAVKYDGTNVTVYTNADAGTAGSSSSNVTTINQMVLGAIVRPLNPAGVLFFPGDLGEVVLYDSALNAANLLDVWTYLNGRWAAISVPGTPGSLAATSYWDEIDLTWGVVTGASSYVVQRSPTGAGTWTTIGTPVAAAYNDTALAHPSTYDYRVAAVSFVGQGSYSTTLNASTATGSFDPTKLRGCIRWGKADSLALSDGTAVSTYTDLSAGAHNFTNSGAARPVFKTNIQNSLAMIRFTAASSQYLIGDAVGVALTGSNIPRTVVLVLKHASLGTDSQCPWMLANNAANTQTNDFLLVPGPNGWVSAIRNDAADAEYIVGAGTYDTNTHTWIQSFDGTTVSIYQDGTLQNQQPFAVGTLTTDNFSYGAHRRNGGQDAFLDGYIGEDVIYNKALTATQAGYLQTYLQARWATPSSALFEPSQIANIVVSYRDDSIKAGAVVSTGDNVPIWYTRTGGTQVAGLSAFYNMLASATNPKFKAAQINSRDCIQFNGTSSYFTNAFMGAFLTGTARPFTIYGVFQCDSLAAARCLWSTSHAGAADAYHDNVLTAAPVYRLTHLADTGSVVNITGGTPDTSAHFFIYTFDGTVGTFYLDGTAVATGTLASGVSTFTQFGLGALVRNVASEFFSGYMGEFGVYTQSIDATERGLLVSYLSARWGIAGPVVSGGSGIGTRGIRVALGTRGIGRSIAHTLVGVD